MFKGSPASQINNDMMSTKQANDIEEIPRLNIQSDWREALKVPSGKAWISCSQMNQPTVYGELVALESKRGVFPTIQSSGGFVVTSRDKNSLTMSFPGRRCCTKFIAPSTVSTHLHKKAVRSVDVSPGGALGVSAGDDGSLLVWETGSGSIRHELQGHISDVNTCRFFPSGKVVLSGGADLRLKIWSAEDGSCPVTLKGHTGGVTDTAIVDRGRNILSCSRDGTVRLWDCGGASCLAVVSKNDCPVNSCALADLPVMTETPVGGGEKSVCEVGTEGKLLLLAKEDGWFEGVDVYNRKKVFQFKCPSPVNCCAFLSEHQVVGGTDNGSLWLFDVRDPSFPLGVIRRSASPILSLLKHGDHGFLAATGDGCCFFSNPQLLSDKSKGLNNWELTGPDCDPVYSICRAANTVFTACRDASIRKYILKQTEVQG